MCGAKKAGNCPEIPTFYGIFVGSPGFWQGDNLLTIKGFTGSPGDGPIEKGVYKLTALESQKIAKNSKK
jgi:hypothetical protein